MQNHLINYILHVADTVLILSQRNSEWCGHGPVLEQDIAITNISLDLIGQSRNFYQYAAQLIKESQKKEGFSHLEGEVSEDSLAYLRTEKEFKNLLLAELPKGDWAQTTLRQYLFSQYQFLLFRELQTNPDAQIAAIATKSLKEITYHLRWSSEWVIRLGDGTTESNKRIKLALEELWSFTDEFFLPAAYEKESGIDFLKLKKEWINCVHEIFSEAGLTIPEKTNMQTGGKDGRHTEHLGIILTDLQYLQRTYPNSEW